MRVLIADDDATSRLVLTAMVTRLGHHCETAHDGSSAWEHLLTNRVDVLLTDWMMPGLRGPELCQRVRELADDHYTYIVLITGLANPEDVLEGMSAGADDYLVKPVDPFSVRTRLVAADRVTRLHQQVAAFRAQLELANHELLGRSLTDALTGLGNRRRLDDDLAAAHERALRTGRPYSLALFDIDHFKLYNDHYGHLAGDDVLRQVAHVLRASARPADHVYRYGGEEFVLLLPDGTNNEAAAAADRLRQAVHHEAIPHAARPTSPAIVTVSGGTASWSARSGTRAQLVIEEADQALYLAKSSGRNRIQPPLAS